MVKCMIHVQPARIVMNSFRPINPYPANVENMVSS